MTHCKTDELIVRYDPDRLSSVVTFHDIEVSVPDSAEWARPEIDQLIQGCVVDELGVGSRVSGAGFWNSFMNGLKTIYRRKSHDQL